jgi:myo-inositol 2-dehydrogenase / D-chiro-inositol 1-dehydrogenase
VIENTVTKLTTAGSTSAKPEFFFLERYMRAYEAEWSAFVASMASGAALPVTLQDGVNALAVAEAATLSFKAGVPIELRDGKPKHA